MRDSIFGREGSYASKVCKNLRPYILSPLDFFEENRRHTRQVAPESGKTSELSRALITFTPNTFLPSSEFNPLRDNIFYIGVM